MLKVVEKLTIFCEYECTISESKQKHPKAAPVQHAERHVLWGKKRSDYAGHRFARSWQSGFKIEVEIAYLHRFYLFPSDVKAPNH